MGKKIALDQIEDYNCGMFKVYRKRKDSPNARWHFNTVCRGWPEADFIQARVIEDEPLCQECVKLEAELFPERS